jgi:hypothetical protein
MCKYRRISEKLSHPENWTDELKYVHITRLICGIVIGIVTGLFVGISLMRGG